MGAASPEKDYKDNKIANITFAAGSLDYDLEKQEIKSQGKNAEGTVAISGDLAGAMHGKHIKFITTDTGAGVKHHGTILSESDIQIKTEQGDIEVQNLHANKKIDLTGKNAKVLAKGLVRANESVKLDITDSVTLEESAKISSKNGHVSAKDLTVKSNATLIATNLTANAKVSITNEGKIAARHNNLHTKKLVNHKDGAILGEETLNITVKGKKVNFHNGLGENGYQNKGSITSNGKATLTLTDDNNTDKFGDFISEGNFLPNAKEHLQINARNILISRGDEFQQQGKVTLNAADNVVNHGLLSSANTLDVNSTFNIINHGLFGAKNGLNLTSSEGSIENFDNATIHSEGEIRLTSKNRIYNLGEIYSKDKIYVNTTELKNDVLLTGKPNVKDRRTFTHKYHVNELNHTIELSGNFSDIDAKNISTANIGKIYAGNGLEFKAVDKDKSSIVNHGILNVKGDLTYDAKSFINNMKTVKADAYEYIFKPEANITIKHKISNAGSSRNIRRGLLFSNQHQDKEKILQFKSLADMMEAIFNNRDAFRTEQGYIRRTDLLITLSKVSAPHLKESLQVIFGTGWDTNSKLGKDDNLYLSELKLKWDTFKESPEIIALYPRDKAKVFADRIDGKNQTGSFKNGQYAENGTSKNESEFNVGNHTIKVPNVDFSPFINKEEAQDGLDLSSLLELLSQPQLFIDKSGYREAPKENTPKLGQDDKDLLGGKQRKEKIESEKTKDTKPKDSKTEEQLAESEKRRKEYEKALEDARRREEELNRKRVIPDRKDLPKVETDALYRTRLYYINQDDYIGSKYFFNRIVPRDEKLKEAKVIGDNYFEHQLITRSIEKKVDNHLSLKYNLSDIQLVKKLMDNAYFEAKDLNLELGQALTKEQQANLKEDIIWYVKANVNGQEVFVPQVYFAKHTLENAEKFRGVGDAVIRARELNVQAKDIQNSGTIAGDNLNLKAENKIVNSGDIFSKEDARLIGKKGIESKGKTYVDEQGNTKVRKSRIKSEGHLYLETDKESDVDLTASEVSGKTGQIKTKNLNLNDTYQTKQTYVYETLKGAKGRNVGHRVTQTAEAESVGTDANFDHLHLSLEGDVNQNGSTLKTKRLTGVVKGDYNTVAGKTFTHQEVRERTTGTELSASVSGGGVSTGVIVTDEGTSTFTNKTTGTSANAEAISYVKNKINRETTLTHKN
ncbi:hypothetical protein NYR85_11070, partial [Actinobacillus equuli subsp. equuli]|nr:hypothetical protein [Actinobacillus equuli subsp. equuli]